MEIKETQQLLSILKMAYPNAYKSMSKEDAIETVKLYYDFFGEHQTPVVVQALKNYIKSNVYPPSVAGLIKEIELLTNKGNTSEELWSRVAKAVGNSLYNSAEEFNKLPMSCQRWLGSPKGLKDLGMTAAEVLNTVVRGQFIKTINEIKASEKAQSSMPLELKELISKEAFKMLE